MIVIKSQAEIQKIGSAGRIVAEILEGLKKNIVAGMTTADVEAHVDGEIQKREAVAAFKGYRGYPSSICISLNAEVVHGIPSRSVKIRNGDLVSIDLGILLNGFYGDAAITIPVGNASEEAAKLTAVAEQSLYAGIQQAIVGNRVSDISAAIQKHVESHGFNVVRAFVGHGIGRQLHEEPQVPNFGRPGQGARLKEGMTLAIEPMVNAGTPDIVILHDGWTAVSADGSLSAHFEHTVAVTKNGPLVLTKL
ncbi:MAG TPA: type I methionyl aminopeptidase [Dissulfurispiraceae bacterium]|nr:type I methionyl aminopeptidase [Dissulfurispiraceae bacterium]